MTVSRAQYFPTARETARRFFRSARPQRLRTMRRFAEQEIVLPDGPFKDEKFRCDRQPYAGLWFDAVDSALWSRYDSTGPTQSGKSLVCFIIPTMYHLFEIKETTICGLPSMDMSADKWAVDIKPAIESSRYRDLLPQSGPGSRDGTSNLTSVRFRNGVTLKFMSGGGSDKKRAGFTARALVITETDGLDQKGKSSVEADKIRQMEARTGAYGSLARIYMECTVTTEQGRTWSEYQKGTASRIIRPCPHCRQWVSPEREHLVGWKDSDDVETAKENASWICPSCSVVITDDERREMNRNGKLLHRGEEVTPEGQIVGERARTDTLGFRWSLFDNQLKTAADGAAEEWNALRAADEDSAERALRQFWWCLPYQPDAEDAAKLDAFELARKQSPLGKGIVSEDCEKITVGIDLGKYLCHWTAIEWTAGASGRILDYGTFVVESLALGVEAALLAALRQFREDILFKGWLQGTTPRLADRVLVDSGYEDGVAKKWAAETMTLGKPLGLKCWASKGHGATQEGRKQTQYNQPKSTGALVKHLGENYHVALLPAKDGQPATFLVEINADAWKSWLHRRWETKLGEPGAMCLFNAPPSEHHAYTRHQVSEKKLIEYEPEKGMVERWVRETKANHQLDAAMQACVAGHIAGVRLIAGPPRKPAVKRDPKIPRLTTPDGRPFLLTERP